jgi:sugar phosphate isomerase/epimerase
MAVIPRAGAPISLSDASRFFIPLAAVRAAPRVRAKNSLVEMVRPVPNHSVNRRQFLESAAVAAGAAAFLPLNTALAAESAKGVNWPIGCLERPWFEKKNPWSYDTALDGIKAAGYKLMGLLRSSGKSEPLLGSDATPEYLANLKKSIAARGLKVNMGALRIKGGLPLDAQIKDLRQQIDNGKTVGVEFLLTFGAGSPKQYEDYYKLMRDAAPYAQERGMQVVLKPHGGASGASEEILRCLDKIKHPNFKIWFDAGNIIYYTGKDPVEQLKPIAEQVTGFCAKDCSGQKGSVTLQFGTGKVDFRAVFTALKEAGFHGPTMVECCAEAATPELITANARQNREYLEKVFATL